MILELEHKDLIGDPPRKGYVFVQWHNFNVTFRMEVHIDDIEDRRKILEGVSQKEKAHLKLLGVE